MPFLPKEAQTGQSLFGVYQISGNRSPARLLLGIFGAG